MPIYAVDIEQVFNEVYTSNVYHVDALDTEAAVAMGLAIVNIHRKVLPALFTVTQYRVSTITKKDGVFATVPVGLPGQRPVTTQIMPQFCRFLVKFSVGYTYPNRKFLLCPMEEDSIDGGIPDATNTYIVNNYINPLLALDYVVSEKGIAYASGALVRAIAMRQLRRASKRKKPVF